MSVSLTPPRVARGAIVLVALATLLAACGSSSKNNSSSGAASSSNVTATLNGSGSTFQQPFNQAAIQAFHNQNSGITINYAGGGSGKGKTDLQTKTVDFAGTDSLPKPSELAKYQGGKLLYFPTVAAPITVSYNLSGVDKLQLSPDTIAKIFQGQIKTWNDPAVKADNAGVNLPGTNITIVHRADASGTTSNFTKFLNTAAPSTWKLGTSDTVNWPSGSQSGQGNAGVATAVKGADGAIGYVDYSDAVASGLKFASIKNKAGTFVAPTLDGASAAVAAATVNADLSYNPIWTAGPTAYPITSPTWIILYQNQTDKNRGTALKDFLTFVLGSDGQALAKPANYAPLPTSLQQKAQAQLSQIQIPA